MSLLMINGHHTIHMSNSELLIISLPQMAPSPTHVLKPGVVLHSFLFLTTAPQPIVYLTHHPVPLFQSSKKKNHKPTLSSPSPHYHLSPGYQPSQQDWELG